MDYYFTTIYKTNRRYIMFLLLFTLATISHTSVSHATTHASTSHTTTTHVSTPATHSSTTEEESTSKPKTTVTKPKTTTPVVTSTTTSSNTYHGVYYHKSAHYVNTAGKTVYYWTPYTKTVNGKKTTAYKCYDSNHKQITCNRKSEKKTTTKK